jgi:hypothetical protein
MMTRSRMIPSSLSRTGVLVCTLLGAAIAPAQMPDAYRHPIGLFADMAADTVTEDLFNIHAPSPGWRFEASEPVPGADIFLDCRALACADLDDDGWVDAVLAGGVEPADPPSRLLWGRPDGTFELAEPSPVPRHMLRATRADVDGDGRTDLVVLVASGGRRPQVHGDTARLPRLALTLLRNEGGRRFARVPLGVDAWHLVLADLDGDDWLDLAATVQSKDSGPATELALLRGGPEGFATPRLVALPGAWGRPFVGHLKVSGPRPGELLVWQSSILDIDRTDPHVLRQPFGTPAWRVADLPRDDTSPCLALGDADADGRSDLFRGSIDYSGGRNRLYLDVASGDWRDQGRHTGLWGGYTYTTCAAWGDADNDGLADLWQCRIYNAGRATPSQLYRNRGDTTFVNATATLSRPAVPSSRRAAWLDADRDGRLDLLATFDSAYVGEIPLTACRPILYRNRCDAGASLSVKLEGRPPNTDALGAVLTLWAAGRAQWRHIGDGAISGGAAPPLEQHFGLGEAAACDSLAVWWPDGTRQVWHDLAAGRRHVLRQD